MRACVLLGMGDQNDKVHLKTFKLFRIIQKKNFFNVFKAPIDPIDHPLLLTLLNVFKEDINGSNVSFSL